MIKVLKVIEDYDIKFKLYEYYYVNINILYFKIVFYLKKREEIINVFVYVVEEFWL